MAVISEADTLAQAAIPAQGAYAYLINLPGFGAGRDKPTPRTLVSRQDLVGV